ncbi:hypothetical protein CTheo_8258 [Ceratobasidium theobromae]|uniref:Uncharacterized protein n=1 Tax=Ceratobasidium theobromae TaxID=1582974 RepID=A0A5N5Q9K3_9AGAM|nr:hypothetical protein CTheo_8258 [Ceratobasidium theobromae]
MKQYASSWGRWVAFVLRLYQRQQKGDLRYKVMMTFEQRLCVHRAIAYCNNDPNRLRAKRILADMAYWFWHPNNDRHFQHLATDQFDDPTVRFAAFINLREDGSFDTLRNAIESMVQIRFTIRIALLMWSHLEYEEGRASAKGTIERISCGLSQQQMLTPFACISVAITCVMTYADPIGLSNHLWFKDDALSLGGLVIDWRRFREAARRLASLTSIATRAPVRGPELWLLRMRNPSHTLRGIYSLGLGRIVFVLYTSGGNARPTWLVIYVASSPLCFALFTLTP